MSNQYLVSGLIEAVRDSGMLPPADEGDNTTRMLGFLNREQRLYLMRLMLSVREAYRVAVVDVPLEVGRCAYPIPTRAVGAKMKLVELLDASGCNGRPLNCIGAEQVYESATAGGAGEFTIRNNTIIFVAAPPAATMRIHYFRRFNKLVPAAEASGAITAIDTGTGVVTVSVADNPMPASFLVGATFDLIQHRPHFDLLASELSISAVDATTMTFTAADLPSGLEVGDFVALSGETPICQAPLELHDVLVQRALYKYLKSQGDPRAKEAKEDLDQARDDALALMCPRIEDQPVVLQNYDAPGWNRSRRRHW